MQDMRNLIITLFLLLSSFYSHADSWEHLYDHSTYQNAKLSPDGAFIAAAVMHEKSVILMFLKREDMTMVGSVKLGRNYDVGNYHWVNNERVVINMVKRVPWREEPQYYGELFAVNYDGSKGKLIYGYKAGEKQTGSHLKRKKSTSGWASLIDVLPEDDKYILIESTPMSKTGERLSTALMLNVYTGVTRKPIATSPIPFSQFITDTTGEIRAVVGTDSDANKQLFLRKDGEWEQVPKGTVGDYVSLISVSPSGKYLYTRDNHKQDLFGIFKLNMEDLSYKSIYTDKNVDVSGVELTVDGRTAYAISVDDGYPAYILLNKKLDEAVTFKHLLKLFPYSSISITSHSDDGKFYIVRVSSDTNPGSLHLYDKDKNKLELLFNFKPDVKNSSLRQTEPFQTTATDGTEINGYFTAAKDIEKNTPAPVVVLVHGGPHGARDFWRYSKDVQYLALNGYSVLQVNYRGSSGYGHNFEVSGHQAWGTLIQQDIHDAYQWLIKQNKASKACIMGGSFGGYSAIQSAAIYPQTYSCAIANAGVYDLELMFEEGDVQSRASGMSYLKTVLGSNRNKLKSISPVNYVEKIEIPLLLAHGKDDERAPFEHLLRLRKALDKANKPYEWFVIDKEEHGFYNPETKKAYMRKVLSFLDQHLKSN